jgi:DNA-directed RNA polymerase subunit E'/Rpb7
MTDNLDNLFVNLLIKKKISIKPMYLDNNYEQHILNRLKFNIEGRCVKEGFVKLDSIKIVRKSGGYISNSNFTSDMTFNVIYSADICNPIINSTVKCKINNINKLGFLSTIGPLSIIVPKELHDNKKLFKDLNIDDIVNVLIVGKKFELNDDTISIIGRIESDEKIIKVKKGDK